MRVGLIGRADHTGLGIQSKEFYDHIPNCKVLVINMQPAMPQLSLLRVNEDWYPGAVVVDVIPHYMSAVGMIPRHIMEEFIKDIDVLFTMETAYDYDIFRLCRDRGIKTILQLNYEFLDYPSGLPEPDVFAAPSMWHFDDIPGNKIYLPVPVNTKKFNPARKCRNFVHIGGRPAYMDRNGTELLRQAMNHVKTPGGNLHYKSQIDGDVSEYQDNYTGGVLVLPRKYGGLSLPINEALAAGMPVITTDISPNNQWLPAEWLVTAHLAGVVPSKRPVKYYEADVYKLAAKIDEFCDPDFYNTAVDKALALRETISWETLLPAYTEILTR